VAIVSHTGYNMFVRTDCDYPWLFNAITFYYTWSMLFLFLHFYYTTYLAAKRRRPAVKVTAESTAANDISAAGPGTETKSSHINGYVMDSPAYALRSRKNGSVNGSAAVPDLSL